MDIGTTSPTTILCVLLLLIGGFFAILFWLFRAVIFSRKRQDENAAGPVPAAPQTAPLPQPSPTPAVSNPVTSPPAIGHQTPPRQTTGQQEVMRILRDPTTGALSVEIEGREYRRLTEVSDEQTGRTILQVITDLLSFTGGLRAPTPTPVTTSPREKPRSTALYRRAAGRTPPTPIPAAPPARPATPLPTEPVLPEEKPVQPSVADFFRRGFQRSQPEPAAPRSFVDEIEAILQRRLSETPLAGGQEMHVRTGPAGDLQIVFQGRLYDSPDAVPDSAARETIEAAVREWESS